MLATPRQGLLALVLVSMLFYAWAAEVWGGMAAITGAFLVGLLFGRTHFREKIETGIHALAYALFVTVFFVNIGLEVNARDLGAGSGLFVIVICLVAVISKIVGSGLGARLGGFSNKEALRVGAGDGSARRSCSDRRRPRAGIGFNRAGDIRYSGGHDHLYHPDHSAAAARSVCPAKTAAHPSASLYIL